MASITFIKCCDRLSPNAKRADGKSLFLRFGYMCPKHLDRVQTDQQKCDFSSRLPILSLLKELFSKEWHWKSADGDHDESVSQTCTLFFFQKCTNMSSTMCIKCNKHVCGKHCNGSNIQYVSRRACLARCTGTCTCTSYTYITRFGHSFNQEFFCIPTLSSIDYIHIFLPEIIDNSLVVTVYKDKNKNMESRI